MGDRANIQITESDGNSMFFYTHWSGTELPEILRKALIEGRSRWSDTTYLSRIIFCELTRDASDKTMGFGLSTSIGDGRERIVEVLVDQEKVLLNGITYGYQEYIELDNPQWEKSRW